MNEVERVFVEAFSAKPCRVADRLQSKTERGFHRIERTIRINWSVFCIKVSTQKSEEPIKQV